MTTPEASTVDITALLNEDAETPLVTLADWTGRTRRHRARLDALMSSNSAAEAPRYLTERASRGDLQVQVSAAGTLRPTNTVAIGSELSGLIDAVFVDENDAIKKGSGARARSTRRGLQDAITRSEALLASA